MSIASIFPVSAWPSSPRQPRCRVPIDPSAVVPGKGHRLIIDATSYLPPDPVGEAHLVAPPTGPDIDELSKKIRAMQLGALQ